MLNFCSNLFFFNNFKISNSKKEFNKKNFYYYYFFLKLLNKKAPFSYIYILEKFLNQTYNSCLLLPLKKQIKNINSKEFSFFINKITNGSKLELKFFQHSSTNRFIYLCCSFLKLIKPKKNFNFLFLRKNKVFNKSRYSRNRQFYRTGVYWCLYINIIAVIGIYFWFYKFTINYNYIWIMLYLFFFSFFFSRLVNINLKIIANRILIWHNIILFSIIKFFFSCFFILKKKIIFFFKRGIV